MLKNKKFYEYFFAGFGMSLLTVGAGLVAYIQFFFSSESPFITKIQSLGFDGIIIVVLVSIVIGLIFSINKTSPLIAISPLLSHSEQEHMTVDRLTIYDALKNELMKSLQSHDYIAVIRLGASISRVLWIAGQYSNRIDIGEMIYEAATKLEDKQQMSRVLIDDIGWTHFVLNHFKEAEDNIEDGLEYAQEVSNHFLIAKAKRHLASIAISLGTSDSLTKAKKNLDEARNATGHIVDNADGFDEMVLGLDYAEVELLIAKGKTDSSLLDEALRKNRITLDAYTKRNDLERRSKAFSQKGKILFMKKDYMAAVTAFNSGLNLAERVNRKDEIVKCNMGLAVAYHAMSKQEKRNQHIKECADDFFDSVTLAFWNEILEAYRPISKI